jgi:hypothetical protein
MNGAAAAEVAARIGGLALPGDVTDEATMIAALEQAILRGPRPAANRLIPPRPHRSRDDLRLCLGVVP